LCTKECQNPAIHDYIYHWVCSTKWNNKPVEGKTGERTQKNYDSAAASWWMMDGGWI
jgi:hypothetical protein